VGLAQAVACEHVHPDEPDQEGEVRDRHRGDRVADLQDLARRPDRGRVEREEGHILARVVAGVGELQVVDRVPAGDRAEELGLPRLERPVPAELGRQEQAEAQDREAAGRPYDEDAPPHEAVSY